MRGLSHMTAGVDPARSDDEQGDQLATVLRDLPPQTRDRVDAELLKEMLRASRADDVRASIEQLVRRLRATVRLQRNPAYVKAKAEADASIEDAPTTAVPLEDLVRRYRARP